MTYQLSGFITAPPTTSKFAAKTPPRCTCCLQKPSNNQPPNNQPPNDLPPIIQLPEISRRSFLRKTLFSAASLFVTGSQPQLTPAAEEDAPKTESVCKNCVGSGKVPCDLCSGTGFWRALAANDPKQRYKGVVCPECEGLGSLTCPVCLGTGEGNVRGLLRRRRVEPGPGRVLQSN
eukprot:GFKZ01007627.1.p1 GENE.GFKZ01007627.1~~GFKZ01007627.1.p1  ORF type:complete len:176 (-),score=8.35 GFKZ01007627.1:219-746(-)